MSMVSFTCVEMEHKKCIRNVKDVERKNLKDFSQKKKKNL